MIDQEEINTLKQTVDLAGVIQSYGHKSRVKSLFLTLLAKLLIPICFTLPLRRKRQAKVKYHFFI